MQIAKSFDNETKRKVVVGALLALSGGIAVGVVAWLQGIDAAKALFLAFVSFAVPTITNAGKEYQAGE